MADNSYFGVRMGEALASGAGHISQALQRKYQAQAEAEERKKMMEEQGKQQGQSMRLAFAKEGIEYDPNNPEAAFSQFAQSSAQRKGLEQQKLQADINKSTPGATPHSGFGVEKLKIGGMDKEIPVRYDSSGNPIPISIGTQSTQKPLTQAQANAAQGVVATEKMLSMIDAAEGKPIGRLGGLGGTLSQSNPVGKLLRIGDPTAQEFASARDEVVDLIARIRTGAVITTNEEKLYANKIYSILNTEGINKKNIQMIKDYFQRVLPKGYNPQTMAYEEPVPMGGTPDGFDPNEFLNQF